VVVNLNATDIDYDKAAMSVTMSIKGDDYFSPSLLSLDGFSQSFKRGITGDTIGSCEASIDQDSLKVKINFLKTKQGESAFRWIRSGILWSFVAAIEPRGKGQYLTSLGIDPYAPIS